MSLDSDNITIERLAGTCGAIVRGIDVSTPQSPAEIEQLKTLLDEHLVIALAEQDIDLDRLEQFTDEFGGRSVTPFVTPVEGRPNVIRVIKEPTDELNFANNWHTDLSYLPAPPAYTILHAREVPDAGGDTMWANQYMAYETLPDKVKEQINGLRTTHSAGLAYGTGGYLEAVADKSSMGIEPSKDAYETRSHPLVIRHPRTGRPALFVNSSYTTEIEGMDADQGRELLGRLMMHATNPNFTCRLRWEPNMLTIWDNATTQHLAINDYAGDRREMFRTSVIGTEPQPA
jgi:taurine dioxygenase